MVTRRKFLAAASAAAGARILNPVTVDAAWFGGESYDYYAVHPFIENHPEAVFIMRTGVDVKTNAKAKKAEGSRFARSVFVPADKSGIPVSHKVAIKPNITAHTVENERFTAEDTMGIATDPDFVEGLIEGMKKLGPDGDRFYLREVNGARVFEERGFYRVAKRTGADLRNLRGRVSTIPEDKIAQWSNAPVIDDSLLQWVEYPDGVIQRKIPYLWPVNAPETLTLNVAKFKAHFMGLTLCCKNFQGAIANGYQHFCTKEQGIGNLPDEHRNPDAVPFVNEAMRRHIADRIPRWDRPAKDMKDPTWMRPDHYDVTCQEIWSHRTLDNLSASNIGLHVIEGVYGRDGDGFLYGPNPPGSENDYEGAAWDYMSNIVVFGKDPLRVDLVGKWLGGHEAGNFGFFHIAMERGMLDVLDPRKVPVFLWEDGRAVRKPLESFERTPLMTCYLPRDYNGGTEPVYHLCDEPFDYGSVRETLSPAPERPRSSVLAAGYPMHPDRLIAIEYAVPRESGVMIEIFDAAGERREVPVRTISESGSHMAIWDAEPVSVRRVFLCFPLRRLQRDGRYHREKITSFDGYDRFMDRRELIRLWMAWKSDRDEKQYTFKKLASDAGLNPNYLSNVMTGIRNPGVKTLNKIVAAFGISLAEFFTGPHAGVGRPVTMPGIMPENSSSAIEPIPVSESDRPSGTSAGRFPSSMIADARESHHVTDDEKERDTSDEPSEQSDSRSGGGMGKTEKFGLKISENGGKGFDMLFSTYGFESSDFDTVDLDAPAIRRRPDVVSHAEADASPGIDPAQDGADMLPDVPSPASMAMSASEDGIESSVPLLKKEFDGGLEEWMENFRSSGGGYGTAPRHLTVEGQGVAAFRMDDDSMSPEIEEGDMLYIDLDRQFTNTGGGIGVVRVGNEFKVRRVFEQGGAFQLVPVNPRYSPDVAPVENTVILKIVLWLPRSEGKF